MAAVAVPAAADTAGAAVHAIVCLGSDRDEVWERIRGHTSDLDVTLSRSGPLPGLTLGEQMAAAQQLAQQLAQQFAQQFAHTDSARVVIWLRPLPDSAGLSIYVLDRTTDRVFIRELREDPVDVSAPSATAEAAGLVVHSALRALLTGAQIGVAAATLRTAEAAQPTRAPEFPGTPGIATGARATSMPTATALSRAVQTAPAEPYLWQAAVAWGVLFDGLANAGNHGVAVQVGAGTGRWWLHLALATHPAARSRDAFTEIEVARHSAALGLARVWQMGRVGIVGAAELGTVLYMRTTRAQNPNTVASAPSRHLALLASAGVRARIPIHTAVPGLSIELGAMADVVVGAPVFVYERNGQTETRTRLAPVQPRAVLGVQWQFP